MMDLWATVPYYTAYLSKALLERGVPVMIGSITYYLDPQCFSSRGLRLDPGVADVVGRYPLPKLPRRVLKLLEAMLNLLALSGRFLVSPPEIVHVQYLPMLKWRMPLDLWFLSLLRWRGAQILLTVHDLLPHDTAEQHRATFARLYSWVDALICHSDHIRSRMADEFGVPVEKISVIPHGPFFFDLPAQPHAEAPSDTATRPPLSVLWQGILFPYKGIDLLLDAWKDVETTLPEAHLRIAGTGSPEMLSSVREQVDRLQLKKVTLDLRFLTTEELVEAYRAAEIVVYPYRAITTSGALATGLSLGKAVIASDLPVFRELLTHGENALLVEPGNSSALAEAIVTLADAPQQREHLAANVRGMRFGEQAWPGIAGATLRTYDALLREKDLSAAAVPAQPFVWGRKPE